MVKRRGVGMNDDIKAMASIFSPAKCIVQHQGIFLKLSLKVCE